MKTLEQLQAFAEGYCHALYAERTFMGNDLRHVDDWLGWGDFDINFIGAEHSAKAGDGLYVVAYPAGWTDTLPAPTHEFTVQGE